MPRSAPQGRGARWRRQGSKAQRYARKASRGIAAEHVAPPPPPRGPPPTHDAKCQQKNASCVRRLTQQASDEDVAPGQDVPCVLVALVPARAGVAEIVADTVL